jgi:hypothetical protein
MRQTECQYTPVAHLIAAASADGGASNSRRKRPRQASMPDQQPLDFTTASYMPTELPLIRLEEGSDDIDHFNHDPLPPSQHDRRPSLVFPQQMLQEPPQDLGPVPSPDDFDRMFLTTPMFCNAIETLAPVVIPSPPSAQAYPTERRALLNLFGTASTEHPFRKSSICSH